MTPQDLIAAFETLAEAPEGIERLRELVLDLAVRGKLVRQDPRDEPVSTLLARITEERTRLIETKTVRDEGRSSPLLREELPFAAPTGWMWVRLIEVAWPQAGFAFKSERFNKVMAGMPLVRIRDIDREETEVYFDGDYRPEFIVNPGDVLVGMDGQFNVRRWRGPRALLNQRVSRLIFYGHTEPTFVSHALQERLNELLGVKAYTTVQHLSGGQIANAPIPLPPLPEQHRIVARVDELMGLIDRLDAARTTRETTRGTARDSALNALRKASTPEEVEVAWRRFAGRMDDLVCGPDDIEPMRQTVLELAVRGRLVPQKSSEESVAALLERIAREKARRETAGDIPKQKKLPPVAESEQPFEAPLGWVWARISQVSLLVTDGVHKTPHYLPAGVPFLSIKDISAGFLDFSNTRFISPTQHEELNRRCNPEQGDILFCRIGTLGKAVVVDTDRPFSLFVSLGLIKLGGLLNPFYLRMALNSPTTVEQYANIKAGGSHTEKLNLGAMRAAVLPIPPLPEQHRIVARVDALMSLIDRLGTHLTAARSASSAFAAAAVHHLGAQGNT